MVERPLEHQLPGEVVALLQKAFDDFSARAEKLDSAYRALQEDVKKVNLELDRKNKALAESLRKLEETQTYLGSILESMNSGVIGVDVMGVVTRFNRAASEISGYEAADVLGRKYEEVFPAGASQNATLLTALRSGKEYRRDEKVIWRKDGHPVPVAFETAVLRDQRGGSLGAVEIFADLSRIKELEEEMLQARTLAALGEMSATVAHEIRNPLGAMGVWAGLLEREFDPGDQRRRTVSKIIEGLARLNRIVSNLLLYTRPVKAEFRRIDLRSILAETVDFVEIEIERQKQNIEVRKLWDTETPALVMADPEKLQQAVMNLCLNAIQAMPDGGALSVSLQHPPAGSGDFLMFSITDTGIGIEEERLDKIFVPFHTSKENGTGLGLAIVKKYIEFHSGHIDVKSTLGTGTAVRVFLPVITKE